MKILKSSAISPFGGLNFVLKELINKKIDKILKSNLPELPCQCKYNWKDIFFSYWSIIFCGGDCSEDISVNLKHAFQNNPYLKAPSADRLLERLKGLATPSTVYRKNRSNVDNEFSLNPKMNELNLKILNAISGIKNKNNLVLDYDNTFIYTNKSDSKKTYTKKYGYCPGIGIIDQEVVYVENRNGNCAPHTMQDDTIERMFEQLNSQDIEVDVFRADSASYQFSTITTITKHVDKLFVKAKMSSTLENIINSIGNWKKVEIDGEIKYRGDIVFTPFKDAARRTKREDLLKEYRLVVTKAGKKGGQLDLFTGESCIYSAILTDDFQKSNDEVVFFYNQRGKTERVFDVMKNDFAWDNLPFSKLEQNTVYLILMAICKNIYNYIIEKFSKTYKHISKTFRVKKFIFRFICIPAKWIKTGRMDKLRIYGNIAFKT